MIIRFSVTDRWFILLCKKCIILFLFYSFLNVFVEDCGISSFRSSCTVLSWDKWYSHSYYDSWDIFQLIQYLKLMGYRVSIYKIAWSRIDQYHYLFLFWLLLKVQISYYMHFISYLKYNRNNSGTDQCTNSYINNIDGIIRIHYYIVS